MLKDEGDRLTRVVVCSPGQEYLGVEDLKVHNIARRANPQRAKKQHNQLKSTMKTFGAEIIDVDELKSHPNSVFTRDTSVCTPQGYIQLRMGLESRRSEEEWMGQTLERLGEPLAGIIHPPGTVEGGDIILAGSVAFLGCSARTNKSGVRQISSLLRRIGFEIRKASIPPPHFHLGGLMSVIGPQQVLCCKGFFERDFFKGFDLVEVDYQMFVSGNVICLGNGQLIAEASNASVIESLDKQRFKVHSLDLSEFLKGQGGPSCLIMPLERE